MATITGLTAARMLEIEANSIVGGTVDSSGHIILNKHDGTTVDAGAYPAATSSAKGTVELATPAEAAAGTDQSRVLTPEGLTAWEAAKILVTANYTESTPQSSYPVGESYLVFTTGEATTAGWGFGGKPGVIQTFRRPSGGAIQYFNRSVGTITTPEMWFRAGDGTGWSVWQRIKTLADLTAASFTQTTAFTSYPQGESRLYFGTGAATGWDFAGKVGEVVTYRDGTDFARQTWTRHFGGSTNLTEVWVRTANAASGWSGWLVVAEDTGWVNFSLNAGYNAVQQCAVRRRNGIVFCKGTFTAPNGGYTTAATLPVGYRPADSKMFPVTSNTTTSMSLQVNADGTITTWTSALTTAWLSMAVISYPIN